MGTTVYNPLSKVVCERVQLKTYLVVAEAVARQTGPVDGVLAFLDVLRRRAELTVKGHHPPGGPADR